MNIMYRKLSRLVFHNFNPLPLSIFNGHFPGEPGQLVLLQLRMMEVVVTTGAIRHAKLQYSTLFTGRMRFL